MKFQSDYNQKIDGFWDGESPLKGILADYARNSQFPFYVVEITEDCEETILRVQDEQHPETEPEEEIGVAKGMRVGVSNYAALKGLEKHVGHTIEIKFLGMKKLSRNREQREFDVELSDRPVKDARAERRNFRRNGRSTGSTAALSDKEE